ncbi:probable disease resistance protein At4g27220 [Dioscorea cayenensis subsp. rotundata]|uniref:Probable disease resistance protein At4g27220 n=1 Tax=Dioscorea cayennensis subsp. rotundata TaxID=55577 RepID=A0AB40CN83_DIOCR|nr:probable disease resistance protein At4g27220 [Dioscorea cayenensis subsp. rotundata]XP_039139635.1 probable disease resistance protein At4g27220 [Dioscorea cayenensis subsp. rotundata]
MELLITIAGVIAEHAWVPISQRIGYLICYKSNIEKLESTFNELDDLRKDVQGKVDAARRERLEEVKPVVQTWFTDVNTMEGEVKRIKDEASAMPNNCFLHINLHYKLGSEAAHHMKTTGELIRKGNFDSVSQKRPPPSTTDSLLFNEGYTIFHSRKSREKKILEALKDEAVYLIGLWGMGGGGKTTLTKEVAKQAKEQKLFDEVVMVTVSQNIDLKRIQTDIAEILGLDLKEDNVDVRAGKLADRLKGTEQKILVILDDLWEMLDLSKVRIPRPQMGSTCKVVITTRNKAVCNSMSCQEMVELKTLTDEESWSLFRSRAGDAVESPTIRELAWNVAKECAGLPLALVVLGTALKGKSPEIWEAVLMGLKTSKEVDLPGVSKHVFQSIQLSFNFLESEAAKSCFLHCCLYPEDWNIPIEELMPIMVGGGLLATGETLNEAQRKVYVLLDQLKACGLLLQGLSEGYVRMHDVVRDVAMQISAKDHMFYVRAGRGFVEWPRTTESQMRNCQRLSLMDNDIKDLPPDPMEYPKLEMLILRGNSRLSSIPEMFFLHMGSLMVLDLRNTSIVSLPKSLSCLTNLRVLNLRNCYRLNDISHINGLKMVEMFILEDSPVSIAPEGVAWVQNVRFVNLGCSMDISPSLVDYFSNELPRFHRLEQLFMSKFAGSFRELLKLRHLTHLFIAEAMDLDVPLSHELVSTSSLPDQLLKFGLSFVPDQPWYWSLPSDRRGLKLMGTKPLAVWVKRLLEKTIELVLAEFQGAELISIKSSIPWLKLSSLEYLHVVNWPNLTKLLGDQELLHEQIPLSQLKTMIIDDCPTLTSSVPSNIWQKLEHLSVKDCPMMLELFPRRHKAHDINLRLQNVLQPFQCLPNLKRLYINNCGVRYVLSFERETVTTADPFPTLEVLHIEKCQKMTEIISPCTSMQVLCFCLGLRDLEINSCPRLTHVFSYKQAKSMQHLINLSITDCVALKAVAISMENKEEASASTSTHAADHESYRLFPNLRQLEINSCPRLTHVFSYKQAKSMQHLIKLSITDCVALKAVAISMENKEEASASTSTHAADHESYSLFPNLRQLVLYNLPQLTGFHHPAAPPMEWSGLHSCKIHGCPKLQ